MLEVLGKPIKKYEYITRYRCTLDQLEQLPTTGVFWYVYVQVATQMTWFRVPNHDLITHLYNHLALHGKDTLFDVVVDNDGLDVGKIHILLMGHNQKYEGLL